MAKHQDLLKINGGEPKDASYEIAEGRIFEK